MLWSADFYANIGLLGFTSRAPGMGESVTPTVSRLVDFASSRALPPKPGWQTRREISPPATRTTSVAFFFGMGFFVFVSLLTSCLALSIEGNFSGNIVRNSASHLWGEYKYCGKCCCSQFGNCGCIFPSSSSYFWCFRLHSSLPFHISASVRKQWPDLLKRVQPQVSWWWWWCWCWCWCWCWLFD